MKTQLAVLFVALLPSLAMAQTQLVCSNSLGLRGTKKQVVKINENRGILEARAYGQDGEQEGGVFEVSRDISQNSKSFVFSSRNFKLTVGIQPVPGQAKRRGTFRATIDRVRWEFPVACTGSL